MPPIFSLALLVVQIASLVWLAWNCFRLIRRNDLLLKKTHLQEMLVDLLNSHTKHLVEVLDKKNEELEKINLERTTLRNQVKILEGKLEYGMKQEEPRYERIDENLV
jgi:hypothetical protein